METFLFLFGAFIIDKVGLGPKWMQPRVVFCLVVMGMHSGLDGSILDIWIYRIVGRLSGWIVEATDDPNVLIALPDKAVPQASREIVTMAVFLLILYAILCLLPKKMVGAVVNKKADWLNFPGGKGLDWVLWPVATTIALLADTPGRFEPFNSGFVFVISETLPFIANFLKVIVG